METTFDLDLGRVSPGRRASAWREWHDALYAGRLVLPDSRGEGMAGFIRGSVVGNGRLCRIACAYSDFRLRTETESDPRVTVWVQISKLSRISISGHDICSLSAGDIVFLSSRDAIEVEIPAGSEVLLFHAPGDLVRSRLPVWNAMRRKLPGDLVGTSVLRAALINAHAAAPALNLAQRSSVLLSLVELLSVPCSEPGGADDMGGGAHHVQSALCCIRERCCDPALDATEVAMASGLSRRRLDDLFLRRVGATVSTTIWNQRLEAARAMLGAASSVTDVAYACGFSDSAHFSRLFKKCYGVGPSKWRGQPPCRTGAAPSP